MNVLILKQISQIQIQIIRYEESIILVVGNLGNLTNIFIFGRHELRKNVCSSYFIGLSLSHLLLLDSLCLARIIISSTGFNIFQSNLGLCKFRSYAFELSLLLSRYFLCLISIDRWMVTSSSVAIRQKSSIRVARWLIFIGGIFWIIYSSHAAIGFETGPVECTPPFGSIYNLFLSIESILTSFIPMIIMSVFSLLTIINVRSRINRQLNPIQTNSTLHIETHRSTVVNAQSSRQAFKRNIQLVRLSILQVILYLLLNTVWSILPLYPFAVGSQDMMTLYHQMMFLFLGRTGLNLLFTYTAITFILYTLASKAFRKECVTAFKQWFTIFQRRF